LDFEVIDSSEVRDLEETYLCSTLDFETTNPSESTDSSEARDFDAMDSFEARDFEETDSCSTLNFEATSLSEA
jgi:hypothetical protein